MKYRTQLVEIAGDTDTDIHYFVNPKNTICNIPLESKQTVLHYEIDDHQICPTCKSKDIPKMKDWNRRRPVSYGKDAVKLLNHLKVLYSMLDETKQVSIGMHLMLQSGSSGLSNWLANDKPNIEDVLEDENELVISYRVKEEREYRTVPYDDITEFYKGVKEEVLLALQDRMN